MSTPFPGPAYVVRTEHLVIRCYNPVDAPLLEAAVQRSLEHLRPWMPWVNSEPEPLQVKIDRLRKFRASFDLGQDFIYGIFTPDETQLIGGTGLHTRVGADGREIGYWIGVDFIGKGYATETAAALTRVAFEVDQVQRVEIHCDPANVRSANVARKLGYVHEATLRQRIANSAGQLRDAMIWSLLAEEYPASPAAALALEAFDSIGRRIL